MKKKVTINYSWWKTDKTEIPADECEALECHAMKRINEQMEEGYTSGELLNTIYDIDNNTSNEYRGWWEVKKEDVSTEEKTYTRDEVVKLINDVLLATGGETKDDIKAIMKHINTEDACIEFDGKDLKRWIKKHVK